MKIFKNIGLILGPLSFLVLFLIGENSTDTTVYRVLAVAALMIVWWITETVHLATTALLPIVLFPLLGILDSKELAGMYGHNIVFLFMGGFMIALAMEKWGLHKRIALGIINKIGISPVRVLLGFMIATAFLSMWISNTATTVMMIPITGKVLLILQERMHYSAKEIKAYSIILLIALAYSANIGGTATLVGTPPNVQLAGIMEGQFGVEIEFSTWMMVGMPFALLLLTATFFMFRFFLPKTMRKKLESNQEIEIGKAGKIGREELIILIVFICTALLWIFKKSLNSILPIELSDTIIAMFAGLLFFVIPSRKSGERLMEWEDMKKLPWGILILFGGGLSLALAMKKVGILEILAQGFLSMGIDNPFLVMLGLTLIALFITEVMSNVAMVVVFVPVVAQIAVDSGMSPLYYAVPVTLAASCAFMFPMATPPNALVFATDKIKVGEMAKFGILLNVFSVILIAILSYFYFGGVLGY